MIEEKNYIKPLPEITPETKKFWEAAKNHQLVLQRCKSCGEIIYFPRIICYRCLSEDLEWVESIGNGTVYSFTIIMQPAYKSFESEVPYVYAIIDLDDGARMISNIVNIEPTKVKIGMRVKVIFDDVSPEISIPKFEPII
ncbi:MAG: Zn-ribbon domain-containing OB-fold protein [Actinobacteria bacterium]|nr:Zn-ribbon domain-containing OB-fold protein [Actinomycetota bacterium]